MAYFFSKLALFESLAIIFLAIVLTLPTKHKSQSFYYQMFMNRFFTSVAVAVAAFSVPQTALSESGNVTSFNPSNFSLTYNGSPVIGMSASFNADENSQKGTLSIFSKFDLSMIPNFPSENMETVVSGPSLFPGQNPTVIQVNMTAKDGVYHFSGKEETELLTYTYSGTKTDTQLNLELTDVELKNLVLVGKWSPVPYETDEYGYEILSNPVHVVWESEKQLDLMGFPMAPDAILKLVFALPLIEEGDNSYNISQILGQYFRQLEFCSDANLLAEVMTKEGKIVQSPRNMVQYAVTSENSFLTTLNPHAIMIFDQELNNSTRSETLDIPGLDINNILGNVMASALPLLANGIPMNYIKEEDNLTIYLGTNLLLDILNKNIVPLLDNKQLIDTLVAIISQDESMGSIAPMIPDILASLKEVISTTTKLEIGVVMKNKESIVENIIGSENTNKTEVGRYNINGQTVSSDYKGIIIKRFSDGSSTKYIVR